MQLTTSGPRLLGAPPTRLAPYSRRRKVVIRASAAAVPAAAEGRPQHNAGNVGGLLSSAAASGLGFIAGDVLAQQIGGESLEVARAAKAGVFGFIVDGPARFVMRSVSKKEQTPEGSQPVPAAAVALPQPEEDEEPLAKFASLGCVGLGLAFFAAVKLMEGHPDELVNGFQDKLISLVVSNYVLWPLANFIDAKFVPKQHRKISRHIITVCWNAWLSTMGHQPLVDTGALLQSSLMSKGQDVLDSVVPEPIQQHVGTAVGHAMSPFVDRTSQALQSMCDLAERLPSCMLDKAFSKSLDGLFSMERSPSQLLEAAASMERWSSTVLQMERTGTMPLGTL